MTTPDGLNDNRAELLVGLLKAAETAIRRGETRTESNPLPPAAKLPEGQQEPTMGLLAAIDGIVRREESPIQKLPELTAEQRQSILGCTVAKLVSFMLAE